jgi:hypothetical protein
VSWSGRAGDEPGAAGDARRAGQARRSAAPCRTQNTRWTRRPRRSPCSSTGRGPYVPTSISGHQRGRDRGVPTLDGLPLPGASRPPGSDLQPGGPRRSDGDRLDLLSPDEADPGRHGTLRAVLDWSTTS